MRILSGFFFVRPELHGELGPRASSPHAAGTAAIPRTAPSAFRPRSSRYFPRRGRGNRAFGRVVTPARAPPSNLHGASAERHVYCMKIERPALRSTPLEQAPEKHSQRHDAPRADRCPLTKRGFHGRLAIAAGCLAACAGQPVRISSFFLSHGAALAAPPVTLHQTDPRHAGRCHAAHFPASRAVGARRQLG